MADTDIEQITETNLSVKLNGIRSSTCEINDENNDNEEGHKINNTDCKLNNSIIEDDHTLESENATTNSDNLFYSVNSHGTKEINSNDNKEQIEVNDTEEEQKTEDDKDEEGEKNEIIYQNNTESRSNEIKKSLDDSRINLDKSVTIVKISDPKQNSGRSGKKIMKSLSYINITLRRSMRNINKLKSCSDNDKDKKDIVVADDNAKISKKIPMITKPTVVNDTKKLVKIAAGTKQKINKKKQTLVIDSNTLIGRSDLPIPMYVQSNISSNAMNVTQSVSKSIQNSSKRVQRLQTNKQIISTTPTLVTVPKNIPKPPMILPNLTDDMFLIEAPSFIVPFIYEKPRTKILKEFLEKIVKVKVAKGDEGENKCKESLDKTNENNQKEKSSKKSETNENMDVNASENEVSGCEKKSDGSKENSFKNNENGDEQNMIVDESKNTEKDDSKCKTLSESTDLKKSVTITVDSGEKKTDVKPKIQSSNYFENPLGKLFMQIGSNLVHEHVQLDQLHTQRRKRDRKGDKCPKEVHMAIDSLIKTIRLCKKNNDPFQFGLKKCVLCNFKSESSLVMAHHLESPHMTDNGCFRCNFCTFQVHSPREVLQHMDTHNIRGRLDNGPALYQCPSCPFEVNHKANLSKHRFSCSKKYRPEINQAPLFDWVPPAKMCRKLQNKPSVIPATAVNQATISGFKQFPNTKISLQEYNKMVLAIGVGAHGHRTISPVPQFPGMVPSFPTTLPNQTSGVILQKNISIKPKSNNQPIIVHPPSSMNNHTYQKKRKVMM